MSHFAIRSWALVAIVCSAVSCEAADKSGVELTIALGDSVILQDGVVVGELVLKNIDARPAFAATALDPYQGHLAFLVRGPDGNIVRCCGNGRGLAVELQMLRLEPGQFVKKPVCLVTFGGDHLFGKIGRYAISAEFPGCGSSPWAYIDVVQGGAGREHYLESHLAFGSLFGAFVESNWAEDNVDNIKSLGDYARENAKLVIYQYAGPGVVLTHSGGRSGNYTDARRHAQKLLSLAREYKIGVELWEYIADRLDHPEKLRWQEGHVLHPVNEFYF